MCNRIRDLREDRDLRQHQVAEAIGITARKYSYIENGIQQLYDDVLIELARFYGTSTDYILGLTDVRKPYPKERKRKL